MSESKDLAKAKPRLKLEKLTQYSFENFNFCWYILGNGDDNESEERVHVDTC